MCQDISFGCGLVGTRVVPRKHALLCFASKFWKISDVGLNINMHEAGRHAVCWLASNDQCQCVCNNEKILVEGNSN